MVSPRWDTLEWIDAQRGGRRIIAMCAGAASGFVWAHRLTGHYWNGDRKNCHDSVALIYGVYGVEPHSIVARRACTSRVGASEFFSRDSQLQHREYRMSRHRRSYDFVSFY